MAIITTRDIGATAIHGPLSNAQLDNNFINLNADIATRVPASEKGAINGVATLDGAGKVPTAQLPSYVDDVLEAANLAAFPASGETGKIYVALDTNKSYRWSGSAYIYITSGAVDSVAGKTGIVTLTNADVGLGNVQNVSALPLAGGTVTGDILNTAAYSAPNNASGVGTTLKIRGSTGTGAAGVSGGNGHIEILGGGATSAWESFSGNATRGGVLVQSGTAQGDAENTYVAGSALQLRAGAGTNNGTQVGFGGTVNIYAGNTTRTDGNTSSGGGLTLWGGRGTQSGYFALGGGAMGFGNDFASSQAGAINTYPGTLTQGGETNITAGGYSTGSAQSYTTNSGGLIRLTGATATTGGDIAFYPGTVYEGIAGRVDGQVKVNNNIVLHAGNYSSYAQPLLVSGTTIKTINGTSVLGSGDIVISAAASGVTTFNTRSGAVTLSSSDVTGALGYTPLSNATNYLPLAGGTLSGDVSLPFNTLTAYATQTEQVNTGNLNVSSSVYLDSAWELYYNSATENLELLHYNYTTAAQNLLINGNVAIHAGNVGSYALPLSGGTMTGAVTVAYTVESPSDSTATALSYGRLQGFGHIHINADTDQSTTEFVYITAGYATASSNSANGLAVGNSTLTWKDNAVLHAGNYSSYAAPVSHTHDYLPLSGGNVSGYTTFDAGLSAGSGGGQRIYSYRAGTVRQGLGVDMNGQSYNSDWFGSSGPSNTGTLSLGFISHSDGTTYSEIVRVNASGGMNVLSGALQEGGNQVLHAGNYTNYRPPLLAPINATSTGISNWNPQSLTYQAWGQAFVNSNISADSGDVTWWLRASQYLSGGTELCMIIDGDYYAGTGAHKVLHAGNYNSYSPTLTGGSASGTWGINITGSAGYASAAGYAPLLSAVGSYTFSASTNGRSFEQGIQAGFVSDGQGYPSYGSVVRVKTYSNDGGTAELYFPYSATYGGSSMRYRMGQYDNAGWTGWKTVLDSDNYISYAAPASHTHSYLPLSGGTLTGVLSFPNAVGTKLRFYDAATDKYGIDVQNSELRIYSGAQGDANGGITFGKFDGTTFTEWMRVRNSGAVLVQGNQVLHAGNYGGYSTFTGSVTSAGNTGFYNDVYYGGARNPIWSFGNASSYGISYFQGSAGVGGYDTVGIHPNGTATATGSSFAVSTLNAYVNNNIVLHAGNYTDYAHSFDSLTSKTGGTGDYMTTGSFIAQNIIRVQNGGADWDSLDLNADGAVHSINARGAETGLAFQFDGTERMFLTNSGSLTLSGSLSATSKSFLIPHPTKPGLQLRYGSLEGPENGVYVRGKLKGTNKIELPEYWTKLVDADSITVTLTPVGKHQRLYVESIADNTVTVANEGLFAGEINCFFVVYAERVDIDKLVVECE